MSAPGESPLLLLVVYGLLILLASLGGGWFTLIVRPTHTRLQLGTSFVAGLMLGVGLLHLLPHAWHEMQSLDRVAAWMLGGFLVVFFMQRFFHFHHHDVPEELPSEAHPAEGREARAGEPHFVCHGHTLAEQSARRLSWTGATLGLLAHSVLDGVAVAASVRAQTEGHAHGWLAGFATFLVVLLHKPFDSLAVGVLLARGSHSTPLRHGVNVCLALAAPLGMAFFSFGLSQVQATHLVVGAALAFSAGTFLCIASSDLLPELQFHAHDRWKLSFALAAGLALSVAIGAFETTGHDRFESRDVHPVGTTAIPAESPDHRH